MNFLYSFCIFLNRRAWLSAVRVAVPVALLLLQLQSIFIASPNATIITITVIFAITYGSMAFLLLSETTKNPWLLRFIGGINMVGVLLLLARVYVGCLVEALTPFANVTVNYAVYIWGDFALICNGVGFLLLARQKDDQGRREILKVLEHAEYEQRQLLSIASHEFRTSAAMIKASLESLRILTGNNPPEVARRFQNIDSAAARLVDLSNTLITQDRLLDASFIPSFEDLELGSMMADALSLYPGEVLIDARLPATPCWIRGDAALLRIALHNLLENARAYHSFDHCAIRLTVTASQHDVEINVADNGPGIPDQNKELVFTRFFSVGGKFEHGLGLSIVRTIARIHDGDAIVLDNQPRGAILQLRLPLTAKIPSQELSA